MTAKKIDIFIKTYSVDYKWLDYCLQAVEKFATGYNKIIICIPIPTKENNDPDVREFVPPKIYANATLVTMKEEGNGYIFQQYAKLIAHKFSDADYIMFMDADCLINKPVNLQDLIIDDKPTILHTPWKDVGQAICWKEPTEKVFDRDVESEFMRRNFLIYHRRTLENFQEWFEKRFQCSLLDYFLKVNRISEFNLLGAYAWFYEHDKYKWIDTSKEEFGAAIGRQFWSYSGLNEKDLEEIKQILK